MRTLKKPSAESLFTVVIIFELELLDSDIVLTLYHDFLHAINESLEFSK
jgi:hypothetical protein